MERSIGIFASLARIVGTAFAVYSHFTGEEPREDPQIVKLMDQQHQHHIQLISVLNLIANKNSQTPPQTTQN